jgi:hypothetical protein
MAPATAIDSRQPLRPSERCGKSQPGRRGSAARPSTIAQRVAAAAATGADSSEEVASANATTASHASSPARAGCSAEARRAKPAPSRTVSPVPHSVPSTADAV